MSERKIDLAKIFHNEYTVFIREFSSDVWLGLGGVVKFRVIQPIRERSIGKNMGRILQAVSLGFYNDSSRRIG